MNPSILLLLQLISEGVGVAKEIADLAKRVKDGGEITQAEIDAARVEVNKAVAGWDNAAKETEVETDVEVENIAPEDSDGN